MASLTVALDASAVRAAMQEILDLYGDGAGVPDCLKARLYRMAARQVDADRLVRFEGLRLLPGSEVEAALRQLRIVRGVH